MTLAGSNFPWKTCLRAWCQLARGVICIDFVASAEIVERASVRCLTFETSHCIPLERGDEPEAVHVTMFLVLQHLLTQEHFHDASDYGPVCFNSKLPVARPVEEPV